MRIIIKIYIHWKNIRFFFRLKIIILKLIDTKVIYIKAILLIEYHSDSRFYSLPVDSR